MANLHLLSGPNFSGRTTYLKDKLKTIDNKVYLKIEPLLDGFIPTVGETIRLYLCPEKKELVDRICKELDFEGLFDKNPFELSGGQRVILSLICGIASEPELLAIDCCMEQLSNKRRDYFIEILLTEPTAKQDIYLVDNRLSEFPLSIKNKPEINLTKKSQVFEEVTEIKSTKLSFFQHKSYQLSLKNIYFGYSKAKMVLKGISFSFESGKIYLLEGENGAGKSTLAKILSGLKKPQKGKLYLDGQSFAPYKYPGRIVRYAFQNPHEQLSEDKISDEVLHPNILKKGSKQLGDLKMAVIEAFGLGSISYKSPFEQPYTVKKRLTIAAAIASNTPFIILDEPTIGQDDDTVKTIAKILHQLADCGIGLIVITHSKWFKELLNHEVVTIEDGKLV